jgi:glycosyltransferase involved in cell wall biosynthesis
VLEDRGPLGRGRARTYDWPESVVELPPSELRDLDPDVLVLQRPEEIDLAHSWLGRKPGIDICTVYVEHNSPQGLVNAMRHPIADRPDLTLVHVTHFNQLFWDAGSTPTRVIEHGIVDPGYLRGRVTGTDLLDRFRALAPVDLFGIGSEELGGSGDVPQRRLHREMAHRRLYLHLNRWTSLGLSLIEAMHIGMPIIALATTEVPSAVPPEAGIVSNRLDVLEDGVQQLLRDPELARRMGLAARRATWRRFGLDRFLRDWDVLLEEIAA